MIVVLPVSNADYHLAKKWLAWAYALHDVYDLVVFCARSVSVARRAELEGICRRFPCSFELHPEDNIEKPQHGYGAAANSMFRGALEMVERIYPGRPMLWCEADTVPMRTGWVQEIAKEYAACGKPFMGDFHADSSIPHMTGNAVYSADWRRQAPSLAILPQPNPECGWDTMCAYQIVPKMHRASTIQQIWAPPVFTEENINRVHPQTALFHRCKDGSLIDVLCARRGLPPIPLEAKVPGLIYERAAVHPAGPSFRMDILIVTYARDMDFLQHCVRSIQRYGGGFGGVTVAVPASERGSYDWLPRGFTVEYFNERPGKGMLHHLVMKTRADELCPAANMILHVDPDCVFWAPFSPADFLMNERPVLLRERYAMLLNPNRVYWKETVRNATGLDPVYETMVRHPQCHIREVYAKTREMVEHHTGMGFDDYVLAGRNEFPQTYCEFNALGAVAIQHFADKYIMMDYDRAADARECNVDPAAAWQYVYRQGRDKLVETWSHNGTGPYEKLFLDLNQGRAPAFVVK